MSLKLQCLKMGNQKGIEDIKRRKRENIYNKCERVYRSSFSFDICCLGSAYHDSFSQPDDK